MTLTLNQIIKRLQTAAESHKQIATFISTDYFEEYMTEPGRIEYPVCVSVMEDPTISRTTKATEHPFKIYFLDLVNVASATKANQADIYSDMMEVAKDFIALLQNHEWRFDWEIGKEVPVQTIRDGSEDVVCGVAITVSISTAFLADRCQVPSTNIIIDDDMATTRLFKYTAIGPQGNAVTFPSMIAQRILGVYRNGIYVRPVTTPAASTREVQYDTATGVFTLYQGDDPLLYDILNSNEQFDILYYG